VRLIAFAGSGDDSRVKAERPMGRRTPLDVGAGDAIVSGTSATSVSGHGLAFRLQGVARAAAERLGERGPGEIGWRGPDLAGDIEAVLEAAALDTATPEPDVEQDPPPHLDPRLTAQLVHTPGCPQDRDRLEAVTGGCRCTGCGASKVERPPAEPLPPPDSAQYRKLWQNYPTRIAEQLTDAERANPALNPSHPHADTDPPGWTGGRPTPGRPSPRDRRRPGGSWAAPLPVRAAGTAAADDVLGLPAARVPGRPSPVTASVGRGTGRDVETRNLSHRAPLWCGLLPGTAEGGRVGSSSASRGATVSSPDKTTGNGRLALIVGWTVMALAVIAAAVALWFVAPGTYRAIRSLQQEVAVSLTVGVLTVGALLWRRASEVKEQREAHIRAQKVPVYESFLSFWFKTLYQGGKGHKQPSQQALQQQMAASVPGFVFWASDDVIRRWNELRRSAADAAEGKGLEKLLELEDLMLAMRADLGQDNSRLEAGDLLGLWVNDIQDALSASRAREARTRGAP
jgi:hypothetical protein